MEATTTSTEARESFAAGISVEGAEGCPRSVIDERSAERGGRVSAGAPRSSFTLRQAAAVLGKSLRALERSLLGKWGNKLPEGWSASRVQVEDHFEWRVFPPTDFEVRAHRDTIETGEDARAPRVPMVPAGESPQINVAAAFAGENRGAGTNTNYPAVVINRDEEVEQLLRELLYTQKQLSEERRLRLEDLCLMTQMQNGMKLLEDKASLATNLRQELASAQSDLLQLKNDYLSLLSLPWWKRIFWKK